VWVSNWIAKRNHKHFILMLAWGCVAALSLFAWRFAPRRSFDGAATLLAFDIIAATAEGVLFLLLAWVLANALSGALMGDTRVDRFKRRPAPSLSRSDALRAVFGDGSPCCWAFPTDAFPADLALEPSPAVG
jgi:hypothetical protein